MVTITHYPSCFAMTIVPLTQPFFSLIVEKRMDIFEHYVK